MEAFTPLSFAEKVRYDRFVKAYNRRLRSRLRIQRSVAEARLEAQRLQYLLSLPAFGRLSETLRAALSFPFVRDRAAFLRKAVRNVARQKSIEKHFSDLRKQMSL